MIGYTKVVNVALERWLGIKFRLVDKNENEEACTLARLGATPCLIEGRCIQVDTVIASTIENSTLSLIDSDKQDWRIPIKEYIIEGRARGCLGRKKN